MARQNSNYNFIDNIYNQVGQWNCQIIKLEEELFINNNITEVIQDSIIVFINILSTSSFIEM